MRGRTRATMAGVLLMGGAALAGRPLAIDDADPADAGQVEVELGAAYETEPRCTRWEYPLGVALGLGHGLELGFAFGGQIEERTELLDGGTERCAREHGIGDLELGAKWRAVEACPLGARHALAAAVKFPTADQDKELGSGKTDYDLTWIASRDFGERVGVHVNAGYSWIGGADADILHYGLALDVRLTDTLQAVGELFAEREQAGGAETAVQYNAGLRWTPMDALTLDLAAGSRIAGEGPDFSATAGLTWTFECGCGKGNR